MRRAFRLLVAILVVGVALVVGGLLYLASSMNEPVYAGPMSRHESFERWVSLLPGSPQQFGVTVTVVPGDKSAFVQLWLRASGAHVRVVRDGSGQVVPIRSRFGASESGKDELFAFDCGPGDACVRRYTATLETDFAVPFEGDFLVQAFSSYDGPAPAGSSIHVDWEP